MGKKYLDTKQSTIEASVLDVWAKSSEEQEAIRNAAEMMVQETNVKNPFSPDDAQAAAAAGQELRSKGTSATAADVQHAMKTARPMLSKVGQATDHFVANIGKHLAVASKSHGQDFLDPLSAKYAKAAHKYTNSDIAKQALANPNQYAKMQAKSMQRMKKPQSEK